MLFSDVPPAIHKIYERTEIVFIVEIYGFQKFFHSGSRNELLFPISQLHYYSFKPLGLQKVFRVMPNYVFRDIIVAE